MIREDWMTLPSALASFHDRYPWPNQCPLGKPISWCLDAGGKQLVVEQIRKRRLSVILEIGVFLGGSARQWLEISDDIHVIAVDPWKGGEWIGRFAEFHHQPSWARDQLTRDEEGFYETFLLNLWPYRDRVTPVRGMSLEVLESIHRAGVRPDLVYLDGDKTGHEIEVCHRLFPQAVLTGDDWFCGIDQFWQPDEGYPIRKSVREFCRNHHHQLLVDKSTWVISREPPSLKHRLLIHPRYQMKCMRRRVRGAFRGLLGLDQVA